MLTLEELAELVRNMREAQRRYFNERSNNALALACSMERAVDRAVAEILGTANLVPLFDKEKDHGNQSEV